MLEPPHDPDIVMQEPQFQEARERIADDIRQDHRWQIADSTDDQLSEQLPHLVFPALRWSRRRRSAAPQIEIQLSAQYQGETFIPTHNDPQSEEIFTLQLGLPWSRELLKPLAPALQRSMVDYAYAHYYKWNIQLPYERSVARGCMGLLSVQERQSQLEQHYRRSVEAILNGHSS